MIIFTFLINLLFTSHFIPYIFLLLCFFNSANHSEASDEIASSVTAPGLPCDTSQTTQCNRPLSKGSQPTRVTGGGRIRGHTQMETEIDQSSKECFYKFDKVHQLETF